MIDLCAFLNASNSILNAASGSGELARAFVALQQAPASFISAIRVTNVIGTNPTIGEYPANTISHYPRHHRVCVAFTLLSAQPSRRDPCKC